VEGGGWRVEGGELRVEGGRLKVENRGLRVDDLLVLCGAAYFHLPRASVYRGTSIVRNSAFLGPYSRNMPRALWRP